MKITKKKALSVVTEIVSEIVFGAVCFLIGWGILAIFGVDVMSEEGSELAMLVGAIIFIVAFVVLAIVINRVKKNR